MKLEKMGYLVLSFFVSLTVFVAVLNLRDFEEVIELPVEVKIPGSYRVKSLSHEQVKVVFTGQARYLANLKKDYFMSPVIVNPRVSGKVFYSSLPVEQIYIPEGLTLKEVWPSSVKIELE